MPFTSKTGKIAGKKSYEINKDKPEYQQYRKARAKMSTEMAVGRKRNAKGLWVKGSVS